MSHPRSLQPTRLGGMRVFVLPGGIMPKANLLTDKQRAWLDAYLDRSQPSFLNATEAAVAAGYGKPGSTRHLCEVIGSANRNKPKIQAEIERRLGDAGGTREALRAHGGSPGVFFL